MSKRPAVLLLALLLCSLAGPMVASAELSGSIEASASTVTMQPSAPSAGDDLAISIAFLNTASQSAFTVEYSVYKDAVNPDRLLEQGIIDEIPANSIDTKTVYWNSLTEGPHRVWVTFEHGGDTVQTFSVPFNVSGLADLRVTGAEVLNASDLKTGDAATVEVDVSNIGTEPAGASVLGVALNGAAMGNVAIEALAAGSTTTVSVELPLHRPASTYCALRQTPKTRCSSLRKRTRTTTSISRCIRAWTCATRVRPRSPLLTGPSTGLGPSRGKSSVSTVTGRSSCPFVWKCRTTQEAPSCWAVSA